MLIKEATSEQLNEIFALYAVSFPPDEVEPEEQLRYLIKAGKTKAFYGEKDGAFAGFALVFLYENIALVSFLAVTEAMRGTGAGSEIMRFIMREYANYTVTVEIEDPAQPAVNTRQRIRREAFYTRLGFVPAGFCAMLYGTCLKAMYADGAPPTKQQYMQLQKQMLCANSFANMHLCE